MTNTFEPSFKVGTVLNNKWVILEFIAKGGMGEVYRAHQLNLKRDVAIKVVSREWLECLDEDNKELETARQRFFREVEAMARIRHPNILQIFDCDSARIKEGDENSDVEYIVMEYVPGSTLRSTMSDEGFYPEEGLTRSWLKEYFLPVLNGVGAMHELNIVHRDLKPENVLMDGSIPKIADFGLARSCRWKPVTQSIHVMGTAAYMSPEQFMDLKGADHKADIYSLGKILFESINGKMTSTVIPMKSAGLQKAETPFFKKLDKIIREATAEDKKDRFQSVKEFRNALMEAVGDTLDSSTTGSRVSATTRARWYRTGIAIAVISAGLMGTWLYLGEPGKLSLHLKGPQVTRETEQSEPPVGSGQDFRSIAPLAQTLESKDGMTLHRVSGGKISLPENFGPDSGKSVDVGAFYMDENQVTNHQYVDFLNQVLSEIRLEKSVVQSADEVWLFLGEVMKGYEPIIFREGKFHIKRPEHASCPVLRVTGYGASAYARFFGKRLPSSAEWLLAIKEGAGPHERPEDASDSGETGNEMMSHMMGGEAPDRSQSSEQMQHEPLSMPSPVIISKKNTLGIRGLNENISEWGLRLQTVMTTGKTGEPEYLILGKFGSVSTKGDTSLSAILRQPLEAFETVGFRCVLSAKPLEKENH